MWYILSAQQNYYLIKYFKIVIKNIVRIARGEWGGDSGERGL